MLNSDVVKKALFFIVSVAGVGLVTFPPNTIAFHVCQMIVSIGGGLGIVSGGTVGTQPKA